MNWLFFAMMTVVSWGLYGVFLHKGQLGMGDAVNPNVNHGGTFFDPVTFYQFRHTNGSNNNVRAAHNVFDVFGTAMGDGYGATFIKKQLCHRLTDNIGAANDNCILS